MCDACDRGIDRDDPVQWQQWVDQQDAWLRETIRGHGWAIIAVEGDEVRQQPSFAYTVGLSGYGHPELLVFGLAQRHAHKLLNELGERVRAGRALRDGDELIARSITPPDIRLFDVPDPASILIRADELYGGDSALLALQVVYSDFRHAFPWELGYRYPHWLQPMPGTRRGRASRPPDTA